MRADLRDDEMTDAESASYAQGGGGVALPFTTTLGQVGLPISVGLTPSSGTQCDVYLNTGKDTAYNNAVLGFYATTDGRAVLYGTYTLSAAEVAGDGNIVKTLGGVAAEQWEVRITLAATLPAANLSSVVIAYGVEDEQTNSTIIPGSIQKTTTLQGPSAAVTLPLSGAPPLNTTGSYIVVAQARVISSSVQAVGDSFSTEAVYTWKNIGGVVTLVPVVLSATNTSTDASLTTTTVAAGVSGGAAALTITLPASLDASTKVQVTASLTPLVVK